METAERIWKRALVVLAVAGLPGAAYAETYHWVDSMGSIHYTHDIAAVPQRYRMQVETGRGLVIKDPAERAALERESRRAIAMREEALKMARERIRREGEEARRKSLAGQKPTAGKRPAREPVARKGPRKRLAANKKMAAVPGNAAE